MPQRFAIITFRKTGPIKTWSDMRGAHVHNARTKPIEHAVPGAPAPEHLIGSGDLVADTKARLRKVGIDPSRMRRNGVIAYEAIMTASPNFFEQGESGERADRLRTWVAAQVEFAKKRWGIHRVVSMVLHLDEKTPHVHIVILPLEAKGDARRRDNSSVRWSLVGRTISGPGQFDRIQDEYSTAMAPFGLVRGVAGSGRKNEPMADFIARIERERREAARAQAAAEAQRIVTAAREQELLHLIAAADKRRCEDEAERRAQKERLREETTKLARDQQALAEQRAAVECEQAELAHQRELLAAERTAAQSERQAAVAERAQLIPAMQKATAFLDRMSRTLTRDLHPSVQQAVVAAHALRTAGASIPSISGGIGCG